ncbi:MAG: ABC transporter ATP-binding protein [Atopobiaceae bacterium]|nr:ABC transporter ATP-binding protein [Atopobiaceae bacterium]MDO4405014.1 ABC transporter ATP-binding protein [Atopobiaceae bacterium]
MKIVLEHITKEYPNRDKKVGGVFTAVSDFDLTIPDGTLVGLLGPSGCGKSTTLNMICGLEMPTRGKIWFGDTDVTNLTPELRGVGMVFQSYALYPHMTVRQNIMFPLENLKGADKLSKEEMLRRVEESANLVQIGELLDRKPSEMSGGQQQRVAIARALVKRPKVLLLDEPLSNLDARLRLTTREEIRRIQRETGITTIFVTHDQEEAMSICDNIVVMEAGIIRQVGRPQDVYDEPANLFVSKFLGTPPINVFDARVQGGQLLIGDAVMFDVPGLPDGPITAGVRPEGFIVEDQGPLVCGLVAVERMGRDKSVVATHPQLTGTKQIRAIIDSDVHVSSHSDVVRLSLRRSKTRLFDAQTGERIHFAHDEVVRDYDRQGEGNA